MKIKFDQLAYQTNAVNAAVEIFEGQIIKNSEFTISLNNGTQGSFFADDGIGIANKLFINSDSMLKNVQKVQIKNKIAPSENLLGSNDAFPQFNIEMETGTGKTFVYFKTILELNQKYGFSKFVIVVPSVAIKEGVIKTYEMTKAYFTAQFHGLIYELFAYDSKRLDRIRQFASANTVDIMVITMDSFNKEAGEKIDNKGNINVIYRENDQLSGQRPIDLISETRPILIIDEPQVVDNTEKAKRSLANLHPSVSFRYSATHKDKSYPTIYRLGAVEAYDQQLVKQIEVASVSVDEDGNRAYLKLKSVTNRNGKISAQIELYKKTKNDANKKVIKMTKGDDLYTKTKLQVYESVGFIQDIDTTPGQEAVYFSGTPEKITLESANFEDLEIKRIQIRRTIKAHLDKELVLNCRGIKVLSLFFLDKVENYRVYGEGDSETKGKYAQIFEEEYQKMIRLPQYKELSNASVPVEEIHDGYFAKDKKGKYKNSTGKSTDDESAYNIIMKNKEGLLTMFSEEKGNVSKANKIRFIFSHSALKEGWDNPNVFQIATLVDTKDDITKRQKVGRGLRIAVNQKGQRVPGFEVNTLTVMANESYKEFAEGLQKEYEEDGISFGLFEDDAFATIVISYDELTEEMSVLGKAKSKILINEMKENDYISPSKHATDKLRRAVKEGKVEVPEEFTDLVPQIIEVIKLKIRNINVKDADEKVKVRVNKEALAENFLELWNKIKSKTTYSIDFDSNKLIHNVLEGTSSLDGINMISTRHSTYKEELVKLDVKQSGIDIVDETFTQYSGKQSDIYALPDIVSFLQNETKLTRKTIVSILKGSKNLELFKNNPLSYMNQAAKIINAHKNQLIIDGIKYMKKENEVYEQSLFTTETLNAYLGENGNSIKIDTNKNKTIYDYVVTDSNVEKDFAKEAEADERVKFYIKLPDWFKIRTPLGPYNPDWALLLEEENEQRLYFIVETKGDSSSDQLRFHERGKIISGKKHFQAVDTDIKFKVVSKESEVF
ncbi:DEAD/DEAH box helicase family protein [Enterococcus pallens]|uniref:Uncharacterized protein n=1 Tax=Enterococcus pallens ATCC BAA-351 TaxID=1158607 RepID=R2T4R2_9ENTE|nr:DEAD/DEAH box helicase family protein [Enterococcus pallens]EOH95249.1 hypothetical protein UAU_01211 [Enterococcus pallens ATCC BAA-351]EOU21614.1 hypothetical protein I588_02461 [Enterococcus pallens ATCC BAA-351]OJG79768.1 hypothetical protein RV10_GL000556 [Enterococcus pallens]